MRTRKPNQNKLPYQKQEITYKKKLSDTPYSMVASDSTNSPQKSNSTIDETTKKP